mgnify:FL=1
MGRCFAAAFTPLPRVRLPATNLTEECVTDGEAGSTNRVWRAVIDTARKKQARETALTLSPKAASAFHSDAS